MTAPQTMAACPEYNDKSGECNRCPCRREHRKGDQCVIAGGPCPACTPLPAEPGPEPNFIHVVFDGPPSHESGRFVEVEDESGKSISFGDWIDRGDGYWSLRFPDPRVIDQDARVIEGLREEGEHNHQIMQEQLCDIEALREEVERLKTGIRIETVTRYPASPSRLAELLAAESRAAALEAESARLTKAWHELDLKYQGKKAAAQIHNEDDARYADHEYRERLDLYMCHGNTTILEAVDAMQEVDEFMAQRKAPPLDTTSKPL